MKLLISAFSHFSLFLSGILFSILVIRTGHDCDIMMGFSEIMISSVLLMAFLSYAFIEKLYSWISG